MSQKKNILHLLSWFPRPDAPTAGNFCLNHIRSVSDYVNSVVLSAYIDPAVKRRTVETVNYGNFQQVLIRVPKSPLPNAFLLFRAYNFGLKYIQKNFFEPELVHLHVALPLGRVALYWKKRHHLPFVLTEHWTIYQPQNADQMTPKIRQHILEIANEAEVILPVSYDLQVNMMRLGIIRPFRHIPNVVDTALFHPVAKEPHEVKHILHVSTLRDEAKNFSGILRVIKQLSEQRHDFVLDVIHDFDKPEFVQYVKNNHLEDRVFFHGKKEGADIAAFYARADFFLLFSNFENLPCVLIESFACGLPVITTDVGGIGEIMDESRGILLHAGDEASLLKAVHTMLDHCQEYDSQKIREYAEAHFSMQVIGEQLLRVYDR